MQAAAQLIDLILQIVSKSAANSLSQLYLLPTQTKSGGGGLKILCPPCPQTTPLTWSMDHPMGEQSFQKTVTNLVQDKVNRLPQPVRVQGPLVKLTHAQLDKDGVALCVVPHKRGKR